MRTFPRFRGRERERNLGSSGKGRERVHNTLPPPRSLRPWPGIHIPLGNSKRNTKKKKKRNPAFNLLEAHPSLLPKTYSNTTQWLKILKSRPELTKVTSNSSHWATRVEPATRAPILIPKLLLPAPHPSPIPTNRLHPAPHPHIHPAEPSQSGALCACLKAQQSRGRRRIKAMAVHSPRMLRSSILRLGGDHVRPGDHRPGAHYRSPLKLT
jgi:hypothetical protein